MIQKLILKWKNWKIYRQNLKNGWNVSKRGVEIPPKLYNLPCGGFVIDDPERLTIIKDGEVFQFCLLKYPGIEKLYWHRKTKLQSFDKSMLEEINDYMVTSINSERQLIQSIEDMTKTYSELLGIRSV